MEVSVALGAVIATCAVLSSLGLIFRVLLSPVYKEIGRLNKDFTTLKGDVTTLKGDVTTLKGDVTTLKTGQQELNKKLDQLISGLHKKGAI